MDALQFEARKVALKQDRTGFVLTLAIHPDECPEEILRDFVGARYGCAFVRIADDEQPTPYNNLVQKAGILCRTPMFQDFLNVENETDAATALCNFCQINSRTELNGNAAAKDLFAKLEDNYHIFLKSDDPF